MPSQAVQAVVGANGMLLRKQTVLQEEAGVEAEIGAFGAAAQAGGLADPGGGWPAYEDEVDVVGGGGRLG